MNNGPLPETRIVGGIEHFTVRLTDGQIHEDVQCARCGSSATWVDCYKCGGDDEVLGSDCIDDLCHGGECIHGDSAYIRCDICRGEGGWHRCGSGPEWCNAHPMPGREEVATTAYDDADA